MKVKLFNCARDILNNECFSLSSLGLIRRSMIFPSLIFVIGIGVEGVEAGTTYSGTLATDSPSFPATPALYYNAYAFVGDGINYTVSMSENVSVYSFYGTFDPTNPSSGSEIYRSLSAPYNGVLTTNSGYGYFLVVQGVAGENYSITLSNGANTLQPYPAHTNNGVAITDTYGKGDITAGTSSSLTFSVSSGNKSYANVIGSSIANVTSSGSSNLFLLGQNQYTGSTTITGGTLSLAKNSIPSGSTINLSGGKLGAAASFTLPNAIVFNQDSTIDAQGQDLVLSGNISGNYGLTITSSGGSGAGSVSLTGTNSYIGTTTVTSGKLKMSSSPNNAQIIFSGGSFQAAASFSMGNSVSVSSTTFDTDGNDIVLSGQLSGTSFTKTGGGMLSLSGTSNQHQGVMSVQAGILAIQSAGSLGDSSTDIALNGGSLKAIGAISGASGNSISVNVSGNIDINGNAFDLLGSLTIISGVQLEVKDSGSGGVFDVSGSTGSSSAGTIKITGGTYRISDPAQMGTDSSTHILNGGTLKISNSTNFDASTAAKTLQALSVTDNSSIDTDAYTVRMVNPITVSSGKSFTKKGSGKMVFSAANTFAGPIVVDAGELDVSNTATQLAGATSLKLGNGATLTISGGGALPPLVL